MVLEAQVQFGVVTLSASIYILTFFLTSPSYLGAVLFTLLKPHPHFQKYIFTLPCAQSGKHQYFLICESFSFCSLLATPFLLIRSFPLLSFSSPTHLSDPCLFISFLLTCTYSVLIWESLLMQGFSHPFSCFIYCR